MVSFTRRKYKGCSNYGRAIYALFADGRLVGELLWNYRPKNAGGNAWEAKLFLANHDVSMWDKDEKRLLGFFKEQYEQTAARGERLHPEPERRILKAPAIYCDGLILNRM